MDNTNNPTINILGNDEMISPRSWQEFRDSGMLWLVNSYLQIFGWSIVVNVDDEKNIISVLPVRSKFRGFDDESNYTNIIKVTEYLKNNIDDLLKEAKS